MQEKECNKKVFCTWRNILFVAVDIPSIIWYQLLYISVQYIRIHTRYISSTQNWLHNVSLLSRDRKQKKSSTGLLLSSCPVMDDPLLARANNAGLIQDAFQWLYFTMPNVCLLLEPYQEKQIFYYSFSLSGCLWLCVFQASAFQIVPMYRKWRKLKTGYDYMTILLKKINYLTRKLRTRISYNKYLSADHRANRIISFDIP